MAISNHPSVADVALVESLPADVRAAIDRVYREHWEAGYRAGHVDGFTAGRATRGRVSEATCATR